MAISNYDYSKQLANLKNAQQKAAVADLQATRNQTISDLNAEQQQNTANYATQRNTANAQNRLAARNFQEYLANTGRANSGLGAQASMQYNNNLNTSLNNIYGAENAANADILRRRTDAGNAYNTGLAKANADIQANYIQALLDERAKRWDRDMQIAQQKQAEKEFKESVRQFNKNYELQKRNFSSGSGGGSSRRGAYYGNGLDIEFDDTPTADNKKTTTATATAKGNGKKNNGKKSNLLKTAEKMYSIAGPSVTNRIAGKAAKTVSKAINSLKGKKSTKKASNSKKGTTSKNNKTVFKVKENQLLTKK